MNFAKFLRTRFLAEHLRWLLLYNMKWISFIIYMKLPGSYISETLVENGLINTFSLYQFFFLFSTNLIIKSPFFTTFSGLTTTSKNTAYVLQYKTGHL